MNSPLDSIRFLADSEHRPVVLDTLADGPTSRTILREVTGASSATVGRILGDFTDRGWVRREGEQYELTKLGAFVAEKFTDLHEGMTAAQDLQTLLPWIPLDEMGIDVDNLAGARVTLADDPIAMTSRLREIELGAGHTRSFSKLFPEACVDARHQAVVEGSQTYEVVFAAGFDSGLGPKAVEKFAELLAHDRTTAYLYEGEMPLVAFLNRDNVCLLVQGEQQTTIGLVETDDQAVLDYAEAKFEEYRKQATPFTVEDLRALHEGVTEA